jgi:hypothetical protein
MAILNKEIKKKILEQALKTIFMPVIEHVLKLEYAVAEAVYNEFVPEEVRNKMLLFPNESAEGFAVEYFSSSSSICVDDIYDSTCVYHGYSDKLLQRLACNGNSIQFNGNKPMPHTYDNPPITMFSEPVKEQIYFWMNARKKLFDDYNAVLVKFKFELDPARTTKQLKDESPLLFTAYEHLIFTTTSADVDSIIKEYTGEN